MAEKNNPLNKKIFLILIGVFAVILMGFLFLNNSDTNKNSTNNPNNSYSLENFNQCLSDKGVVIYGSKWCPACSSLVETLGGYEKANPVYVECTIEQERCQKETKTNYVPEIQINGEVYEGSRSLNSLAEITGCQTSSLERHLNECS